MTAQALSDQVLSLESSLEQLTRPLQAMLDEWRFMRCSRLRLRCSSMANRIAVAVAAGTMPDVPADMPLAFADAAGKAAGAAQSASLQAADDAMDQAHAALLSAEMLVPLAEGEAARNIV